MLTDGNNVYMRIYVREKKIQVDAQGKSSRYSDSYKPTKGMCHDCIIKQGKFPAGLGICHFTTDYVYRKQQSCLSQSLGLAKTVQHLKEHIAKDREE